MGLRKQGESLINLNDEVAKLQRQLKEVRAEVQTRTTDNGRLAVQLGLQRQSQASELTQNAILASAVGQLSKTPQGDEAVLRDLTTCRAQIAALIEENDLLECRLRQAAH